MGHSLGGQIIGFAGCALNGKVRRIMSKLKGFGTMWKESIFCVFLCLDTAELAINNIKFEFFQSLTKFGKKT